MKFNIYSHRSFLVPLIASSLLEYSPFLALPRAKQTEFKKASPFACKS